MCSKERSPSISPSSTPSYSPPPPFTFAVGRVRDAAAALDQEIGAVGSEVVTSEGAEGLLCGKPLFLPPFSLVYSPPLFRSGLCTCFVVNVWHACSCGSCVFDRRFVRISERQWRGAHEKLHTPVVPALETPLKPPSLSKLACTYRCFCEMRDDSAISFTSAFIVQAQFIHQSSFIADISLVLDRPLTPLGSNPLHPRPTF